MSHADVIEVKGDTSVDIDSGKLVSVKGGSEVKVTGTTVKLN